MAISTLTEDLSVLKNTAKEQLLDESTVKNSLGEKI